MYTQENAAVKTVQWLNDAQKAFDLINFWVEAVNGGAFLHVPIETGPRAAESQKCMIVGENFCISWWWSQI